MAVMSIFITRIALAVAVLFFAPLVLGLIKSLKAKLQNRRGPRLWQPYLDIIKLLKKDEVVSPTTCWVFRVAPFGYLALAFAAAALLPLPLPGQQETYPDIFDVFLLMYVLAAGRFILVLASLDAGSTFGGMGGSREMYVSVLVEPVLVLAFLTVAAPAGSTGLEAMARQAAQAPFSVPYVFAGFAFFILLLAETGRVPVDNPDTHLELTMIHEGMLLEYSGRRLGLIHLAAAVRQLIIILLFVIFFIPWQASWGGILPQVALKVVITAAALAVTETCTNKMRLFRLPGFIAISGLLSLLALVAQ
ncbi:formate hydrogenlyase [Anaerosporomusa subterranea]|uniref:Formate hydrogenlyase n=2 Tax=Anaerosporomusa subterranea TaxID=1794912 RepID=A0A154BN01_ANASB|nr:formate hydrogenlyase [Anaerosporomusa subterranea]